MERDRTSRQEREEIFERIPWDALQQPKKEGNRLVVYLAAAVVVGALGFSLVRDQPAPVAQPPTGATPTAPVAPVTTASIPVLISEADLYAVDRDSLASHAVAHAEWFAAEFAGADGSPESNRLLELLLPQGVPLPVVSADRQVRVDWVRATAVTETAPMAFQVDVLVRTTMLEADGGSIRQAPRAWLVDVSVGPDGLPRVVRPPMSHDPTPTTPHLLTLGVVPDEIRSEAESSYGPVVGGEQGPDGRWRVVVMATDPDGVIRPRTVAFP